MSTGINFKDSDRKKISERGLQILKVEEEDGGEYECRAEVISQGNVKVFKIILDVLYGPKLLPMEEVVSTEGQKVVLTCQALGNPLPSVQWFKRESISLTSPNGKALQSENNVLTIESMDEENAGNYRCIAENNLGKEKIDVHVLMAVVPVIVTAPHHSVLEGSQMELVCEASGVPSPTLVWYRQQLNGTLKLLENSIHSEHVKILRNKIGITKLVIKYAGRDDKGIYVCTGSNGAGSDSKTTNVSIETMPRIYARSDPEVLLWRGGQATLSCFAVGLPPPTVSWVRGEEQTLLPSSDTHTIINTKEDFESVSSVLQIKFVENSDINLLGNYSCVAKNHHGHESQVISVSQAFPPDIPRNIAILETGDDYLSIAILDKTDKSDTTADPSQDSTEARENNNDSNINKLSNIVANNNDNAFDRSTKNNTEEILHDEDDNDDKTNSNLFEANFLSAKKKKVPTATLR